MYLTFNKDEFCNKFLAPISKISDSTIVTVEGKTVTSVCKTVDNNTIMVARCTIVDSDCVQPVKLNIYNVQKFIRAFDCISDTQVVVTLNNNNIEYKSTQVKFKFHLLEDGIIAPVTLSVQKIDNFEYDTHFKMSAATVSQLIKTSAFITASNKIYFYTEDGKVMGELTDRTKHNMDSMSVQVADRHSGTELTKPFPYMFDSFRHMSTLKTSEIDVHINTSRGIMCMDVTEGNNQLKYILTAMVG